MSRSRTANPIVIPLIRYVVLLAVGLGLIGWVYTIHRQRVRDLNEGRLLEVYRTLGSSLGESFERRGGAIKEWRDFDFVDYWGQMPGPEGEDFRLAINRLVLVPGAPRISPSPSWVETDGHKDCRILAMSRLPVIKEAQERRTQIGRVFLDTWLSPEITEAEALRIRGELGGLDLEQQPLAFPDEEERENKLRENEGSRYRDWFLKAGGGYIVLLAIAAICLETRRIRA